jgi:MFS transporter, DHA1 family, tetracycline resistance protein
MSDSSASRPDPSPPAAAPGDVTPMDMPQKRAAHLGIFLTVLIDLIGFGILIPILQPFAQRFGASDLLALWLMGIYSLMQFVFSPVLGVISDRVGRRPVIIASLVGSMIGYLIIAAAGLTEGALAITLLFFARIVTGVCGASFSTAQAALADITAPEKRAGVMGMIGAAFGIGFVLGPVIGGLTSNTPLGPSLPFYIAAAMSAGNAFYCWKMLPETLPPERRGVSRRRPSIMSTLRRMKATAFPSVLLANFLLITAFSIMTATFVIWTTHTIWPGDSDADKARAMMGNGKLFGFIGIIAVVIQGGLIRRMVKNGNERLLALAGVACMAVSLVLLPLSAPWFTLLLVCALMSAGNSFATPTLNALASQCGTVETQGETMGAMSGAGSLGRFLGPFMAGLLLHQMPQRYDFVFWLSATIMLAAGLAVLRIRPAQRS